MVPCPRRLADSTDRLIRRPAARAEPLSDEAAQLGAQLTIGMKPLLAAAAPVGDKGIDGRPVFNIDGHGPGPLPHTRMRLRGQADDEIEGSRINVLTARGDMTSNVQ